MMVLADKKTTNLASSFGGTLATLWHYIVGNFFKFILMSENARKYSIKI